MNKLLVFLFSTFILSLVGCSDNASIQFDELIEKVEITKLNDTRKYHGLNYDSESPIALEELQNIFDKAEVLEDGTTTIEKPDFNFKFINKNGNIKEFLVWLGKENEKSYIKNKNEKEEMFFVSSNMTNDLRSHVIVYDE